MPQHAPTTTDTHGAVSPVREMMQIALPAIVTMTSYAVMTFVDRWIVSELGADALAGVGNGGIFAFLAAAFGLGSLTVINTYASQNLGAGKPREGSAYAWNGLWVSVMYWAIVLLPIALFLPQIFAGMRGLFGVGEIAEATIRIETDYGRILLSGMVFTIAARGIAHYFYGLHKSWVVMISSITGNIVNLPLTYMLVHGLWIMPELGTNGAAVATVVGSFIELAIPMAIFLSAKYDRAYHTRRVWRPSLRHVHDLMRIGWPAGFMFSSEIVCWWVLTAGYTARFGSVQNAAGWAAMNYMHLSFMPAVGISIAATALVGKCMGAGRPDLAVQRTWLCLKFAIGYMAVCALCFVLFRHQMLSLFSGGDRFTPEEAAEFIRIGSWVLIVAAAFQVFDAVAITVTGALRGAGDTVWPGLITLVLSWSFIMGGGWLMVTYAPGLESIGPWMAGAAFIIVLAFVLLLRFMSGTWKSKKVLRDPRVEELKESFGAGILAAADEAYAEAPPVHAAIEDAPPPNPGGGTERGAFPTPSSDGGPRAEG